jgi:hypothetical protein
MRVLVPSPVLALHSRCCAPVCPSCVVMAQPMGGGRQAGSYYFGLCVMPSWAPICLSCTDIKDIMMRSTMPCAGDGSKSTTPTVPVSCCTGRVYVDTLCCGARNASRPCSQCVDIPTHCLDSVCLWHCGLHGSLCLVLARVGFGQLVYG